MNNENNIPRELIRDVIRSQYPDTQELTDEEIDEMIDNGSMQLQVIKFSPSCSKKIFKMLDSDASEEEVMEAMRQQIIFLAENGDKRLIENDGSVEFYEFDEKKLSKDDTSNVEPISPEDLKNLFERN